MSNFKFPTSRLDLLSEYGFRVERYTETFCSLYHDEKMILTGVTYTDVLHFMKGIEYATLNDV